MTTRDYTHDELRSLVSVHALDALDPEDADIVRLHLAGCVECRQAFDDALEAAAVLALAAPAVSPPTDLRERILAAARAEPPPPLRLDTARARRTSRELVPSRVIAALCAVAAAVAVIVAISAHRDSSRLRSELAALSDVAQPGSQVVYLKRGQTDAGVAVVVRRGAAPLLVSKLARAPAGRVYQVWAIGANGAAPVSAGLLDGGGDILIHLSGSYPPGTTIAITVEPGGGSKQPTSTPIMAGSAS